MALNLGYNHTEEEAPLGVLVDVDCEVVGYGVHGWLGGTGLCSPNKSDPPARSGPGSENPGENRTMSGSKYCSQSKPCNVGISATTPLQPEYLVASLWWLRVGNRVGPDAII